jgi:prolyl-tRNA synthetase
VRTLYDASLGNGRNYVTGGNKLDVHLTNVRFGRDLTGGSQADLSSARQGDKCPRCGDIMRVTRGIEVGHIFKLGLRYSEPMKATFLDPEGVERTIVMGTYGIGVTRTVAAVIEQLHDENGMIWPISIAPYHVHIVAVNVKDDTTRGAADRLYEALQTLGIEVLYDDRDERPGAKFKDADLLGIPLRVTVGEKGLKEGVVELKDRRTGTVDKLPVQDAADAVARRVRDDLTKLS